MQKEVELIVQSLTVYMLAHGCDSCPVSKRCAWREETGEKWNVNDCGGQLYDALEEHAGTGDL